MDILVLYLFTRLDAIHAAFGFLTFVSFIALFAVIALAASAFGSCSGDEEEEVKDSAAKLIKSATITFLVFAGLYTATPTSRDMAIIVGGHWAYEGVTSEYVTGTALKLHELVNRELDEALAESHDEASGE